MTVPFTEGRPSRPCPLCGDELAITPLEADSAMSCRACGGRWLACEDLEPYLRRLANDESLKPSPMLHDGVVIVSTEELARSRLASLCPLCRDQLESLNYAYDSNIMLGRCPHEHGVWIKKDQLRSLAAFVKGHQRMEPALESMRQARREREEKEERQDQALFLAAHFIPVIPIWFFPYDTEASESRAPAVATYAIILLNILVFMVEPDLRHARGFVAFLAFIPGIAWFMPWTLVTHLFLHADIFHIGFNMYFLWLFGRDVENDLGAPWFLKLYFFSGMAAAISQVLMTQNLHMALMGASGAISGVMGAFFMRFPRAKVLMRTTTKRGDARVPSSLFLGLWLIGQLYYATHYSWSHIAFFAHIGGFAAGFMSATRDDRPKITRLSPARLGSAAGKKAG